MLGGGTVEGALEQGEPVTDSVYDMADLCEDAEDTGRAGRAGTRAGTSAPGG